MPRRKDVGPDTEILDSKPTQETRLLKEQHTCILVLAEVPLTHQVDINTDK